MSWLQRKYIPDAIAEKGPLAVTVRLIRPGRPPLPRPRLVRRSSARSSRSSALILEARSRFLSSSSFRRSVSSLRTFLGLKRLGPRDVAPDVWGVRELVGVDLPLGTSMAVFADAPDVGSPPPLPSCVPSRSLSLACEGISVLCEEAPRPLAPLPPLVLLAAFSPPRGFGGMFYTIGLGMEMGIDSKLRLADRFDC